MKCFTEGLKYILENGDEKTGPQGVNALAVHDLFWRFPVSEGLPLITSRDMEKSFKAMRAELLWNLSGSTKLEDLHKYGVTIWDKWDQLSDEQRDEYDLHTPGDLGPIYGKQWRRFAAGADENGNVIEIDQIQKLVNDLKTFPDSRRLIVSAWNPYEVDKVFVAPCHCFWKAYAAKGKLSLTLIQRAGDMVVGVPFDIAEYAILLHMLAQATGLIPHELCVLIIDAHIYVDQIPFAEMIIEREPRPLPRLLINESVTDIFNFQMDDFIIEGYNPHPAIRDIPVAI